MKDQLKIIPTISLILFATYLNLLYSQENREGPTFESNELIDSINDVAWKYVHNDIEKFKDLSKQAWQESEAQNYLQGKCISSQSIGTYYYLTSKPDSAFHFYNLSLEYRKLLGDSSLISGALNNLGNLSEKQGLFRDALNYYANGLDYLAKKQKKKRARLYNNLSVIYQRLSQLDFALINVNYAIEIYEISLNDSIGWANCLLNKGNIYESMLDYDEAELFYERSLRIFSVLKNKRYIAKATNNLGVIYLKQGLHTKAKSFFNSSLNLFKELNSISGIAGAELNLATISKLSGNYSKSLQQLEISLVLWRQLKDIQKENEVLIQIGILNALEGKYEEAETVITQINEFELNNPELELDLHKWMAHIKSSKSQFQEASAHYAKSLQLKDSLNQDLAKNYQLERENIAKSNKIALLEKDKIIQQEKMSKNKIFTWALVISFIILVLLFFAYYKYIQANSRKKRIESELKAKQDKITSLLKDQELISIRQILEIQESERERIAQDLHDRLGGMLSMVKVHFRETNQRLDSIRNENNLALNKASTLIDDACDEVRRIAHNLSSGVLKNFGMVAAIQDLKSTLENTDQYEVEFITHNLSKRINADIEVVIYRIMQELISNIIRHAKANEISIQLLRKNGILFIEVMDNGIGFDLKSISEKEGMGFKNIESRLFPLDGNLKIDSQIGNGTTVFVEIPINRNNDKYYNS